MKVWGFQFATVLGVAAVAATAALAPVRAQDAANPAASKAVTNQAACGAPTDLVRLDYPLNRMARRLAGGLPITIVAIGSSSTAGSGASTPAMSYPSRLQVELTKLFPRATINVINRGVGGETTKEMLDRFDADVFALNPDVVVWQVGSNSVLRDQPVEPANARVHDGLTRLKAKGIDVILMNPQYAPKVIAKASADQMVDVIDKSAKQANVCLFQRFAVMRYWRLTESIPFDTFLSSDELHMNDWSYACVAKLLATAMAEAATRPTMTAGASPAR